jgi:hypothetical protein
MFAVRAVGLSALAVQYLELGYRTSITELVAT